MLKASISFILDIDYFVFFVCFFFLFLFAGVVPLATYMRIYRKGDIVDIKVNYKTGELTTE